MGFSTGGSGKSSALTEINVTPLVDVMLVLLIIFMVAAPMMTTGVPVDLPDANAPRMEVEEEKLIISITKDKKVFLGDVEVPGDRLNEVLVTNERLKQENEAYLQADTDVPYGFVVQVFALIRQAGVEKVGLITDPLTTGAPVAAQ